MKIEKYDVFDVHQDGKETFRAVAIEDGIDGYVKCSEIKKEGIFIKDSILVDIDNEIEKVLFNFIND